MTFKQALRAKILADAGIVAELYDNTSVYTYPAPQTATLPYIILSRVSGEIMNNLNNSENNYDESWQVSCLAATDLEAEDLKEAVVGVLNKTQGSWSPDGGSTRYTVWTSYLESTGPDIAETADDGSQRTSYHKPLIFRILRSRSAS